MTTPRKPRTDLPGYFKGISRRLELQVELMTPVIVHSGEMGDNDHVWFADLLRQYLPQKFGVTTGFVVNRKSDQGSADFFLKGERRTQDPFISPQMDILALDVLHNAPFCVEKTFTVCPVEMVLGAVEVTRDLDAVKLRADCLKLSRVKELAGDKCYSSGRSDACRHRPVTFAVGLTSSLSLDAIREVQAGFAVPLQPDGVFLLDKAVYLFNYQGLGLIEIEDNRLYHFIAFLRQLLERMPVGSANLQAYLPSTAILYAFEQAHATENATVTKTEETS